MKIFKLISMAMILCFSLASFSAKKETKKSQAKAKKTHAASTSKHGVHKKYSSPKTTWKADKKSKVDKKPAKKVEPVPAASAPQKSDVSTENLDDSINNIEQPAPENE